MRVEPDVLGAIKRRLGVPDLTLWPLSGGTNDRTFLATYLEKRWVVRIEPADGVQLRRAYAAQSLALEAGVATPRIVAAYLDLHEDAPFQWLVEEFIPGQQFYPMLLAPAERNDLARQLGQQLRTLHSVVVDDFGIMPPDPWGINQPTFATWIDHELSRVGRAMEYAGLDPSLMPQMMDVYAVLRESYHDRPRLCHGDCATTNILVAQSGVVALIDWEWAKGGDPAANIAYWAFWQDDQDALDALLAGYQAVEPARFRARVHAYRIYTAIDLILVYQEHGSPADIRMCRKKLETALRMRAWEG